MSNEKQEIDTTRGFVNWNELVKKEMGESREFYSRQLGWTVEEMELPDGIYSFLKLGDRLVGGMLQSLPDNESTSTMWIPYITVSNLKVAVARSISLGAKLIKDITLIPEMGSFAIILNSQGVTLGLWTYEENKRERKEG